MKQDIKARNNAMGVFFGISPAQLGNPYGATATADGTTTAIIPDGTEVVEITCATATHWCVLPTPTPETVLFGWVTANGCEIRSSAPATVGINGGTGASAEMALAANIPFIAICTSATNWEIYKFPAREVAA